VEEATALCRGGQKALLFRNTPWVDWSWYWGAGDESSLPAGLLLKNAPVQRGVAGALLDLEYQRVELIKFNLFDNNGTYQQFVQDAATLGDLRSNWTEMRLAPTHPNYRDVGGDGPRAAREI